MRVITDASGSSKYYMTVKINDFSVYGFIDFGSACVTITESVARRLKLEASPCENIVLSGFGGSKTNPIGVVVVKIQVDEATCDCKAYIVPDSAQDIGTIIGQPLTEHSTVYVIKTPTSLKIFNANQFLELPGACSDVERVKLVSDDEVILKPGVNKILLSCFDFASGSITLRATEYNTPRAQCIIPECDIEVIDGKVVLNIINITNEVIKLPRNRCVARATITDGINKYKIGEYLEPNVVTDLESLLHDYSDCFSGSENKIGKCSVQMHIELTDTKPIYYRPYRMSLGDREKVRDIVSDLLSKGIVEESNSPYASPVILVPKKSGEVRMCVDYRALNKITKKERYPLPVIQDQLDQLSRQRVFTCLDIMSAYHCIQIADDSKQYTAFITPDGHYQYTRMSFGLVNAPSVFQRAMDNILGSLRFQCATAYLDDILVYAENYDDALRRLKAVLEKIRDANVTLRLDKCSFLVSSIEYLGHEVCDGEVRPSKYKLTAVHDFAVPGNVHQVRQFMGLANYFRKYVPNFASLARPITILTKKDQPWVWGEEQSLAFHRIKSILVKQPVLALFNPDYETQIHTDASKIGLGGILLQKQPVDGAWKPVAYASRQTTSAEQKYHSFELETLAVVMSLKKFKIYVSGLKFVLVTDCSALRWTWSKRDLSPRIARWWLEVQGFDFTVEYRAGKSMAHVDALSRNPVDSVMRCVDKDLIECVQQDDDSLRGLVNQLNDEVSKGITNGLAKDFLFENGVLYKKVGNSQNVVVPRMSRWSLVQSFHDNNGHVNFNKTYNAIRSKYWFHGMRRFIQKYTRGCISCQYAKKPTGRRVGLLHPIEKVAVPFHTIHVDHLGPFCKSPSGKMHILAIIDAFTRFIWIEAVRDVSCKYVLQTFDQFIKTFGVPSRIISDRGKAFSCKDFKEYCTHRQIKHVMTAVASPRANGQIERFNRTILDALVAYVGDDQNDWEKYLPKVQLGLNSNVNNSTGKTPLELLYGFRPRLVGDIVVPERSPNLDELREVAVTRSAKLSQQAKDKYDQKRRYEAPFKIGDLVLAERKIIRKGLRSGKLMPRFDGPYKIVKVLPHDRYVIKSTRNRGRLYENVLARDKLKLFHCNHSDESDNNSNFE